MLSANGIIKLCKKTAMCKNGVLLTTKGLEMLAFAAMQM